MTFQDAVLAGRNFVSGDSPETSTRVFFEDTEATVTLVTETAITVRPPSAIGQEINASTVGVEGSVCDVTIVNPDGQAFTVEDYFFYAPQPVVSGLVDMDNLPVFGGPATGGTFVRLLGENFAAGISVTFGEVTANAPAVVSDTVVEVSSPASLSGPPVAVTVIDEFGREATAAQQFEYKDAPQFDAKRLPGRGHDRLRRAAAA